MFQSILFPHLMEIKVKYVQSNDKIGNEEMRYLGRKDDGQA